MSRKSYINISHLGTSIDMQLIILITRKTFRAIQEEHKVNKPTIKIFLINLNLMRILSNKKDTARILLLKTQQQKSKEFKRRTTDKLYIAIHKNSSKLKPKKAHNAYRN